MPESKMEHGRGRRKCAKPADVAVLMSGSMLLLTAPTGRSTIG